MLLCTAIITTLTLRRQILLRQSLGRSGGLDQRPPAGRRRGGQAGQEEPVRGMRVAALDERRVPDRPGRLRVEGQELQVQQEVDVRPGQDEGALHRRQEVHKSWSDKWNTEFPASWDPNFDSSGRRGRVPNSELYTSHLTGNWFTFHQ